MRRTWDEKGVRGGGGVKRGRRNYTGFWRNWKTNLVREKKDKVKEERGNNIFHKGQTE